MASQVQDLHFLLFPLMAQGHMIPMVDVARLLAKRGIMVTIVTTPLNAKRFEKTLSRAMDSGLHIHLLQLQFPCQAAGLPEGCENFDMLPSLGYQWSQKFFAAIAMLKHELEAYIGGLNPKPSCMISDMGLPWTTEIAQKFHFPRIVFHGTCCFSLLCSYNLRLHRVLENVKSETEVFLVPGLPDQIELTKSQLPGPPPPPSGDNSLLDDMKSIRERIIESEKATYGTIVNTFMELEPGYVNEYRKAKEGKVWCIGPVSLCNKDNLDKAERGNQASIDQHHCLKWLDLQELGSVLYVCLGTLSKLNYAQMVEIGQGIEASSRPFVWVVRSTSDEFEKWVLEEGFEERNEGKGLLIRGWASQVLILSHPAIGGFFTHCGWNSTLEGVCAGLPVMTWPMFAEQFCNEKLVVEVLRIGVSLGIKVPILWGEEEKVGVLVERGNVKEAIDELMDGGEEGEKRRERAKKLGEMAKRALEDGGSSHLHMTMLIQGIVEQLQNDQST